MALRRNKLCIVPCFELADGFFFFESNTDIIKPEKEPLFNRRVDLEVERDLLRDMQGHGLIGQMDSRFKIGLFSDKREDLFHVCRRKFYRQKTILDGIVPENVRESGDPVFSLS